uniref:Putative reverse transcriptase domain-containing protein n=1 Tax=Tanacetum cinerariifolium TaxID=118510 RepID=A0A6L2K3Z4_TANCI|nr:putative reverse transcriptase domain-containing protein [Tanacetum cinerariifolium]
MGLLIMSASAPRRRCVPVPTHTLQVKEKPSKKVLKEDPKEEPVEELEEESKEASESESGSNSWPLDYTAPTEGSDLDLDSNVRSEAKAEELEDTCDRYEFLACKPRDFDGKGGTIVFTRWIDKMESVMDISGCVNNQRVRNELGAFQGIACGRVLPQTDNKRAKMGKGIVAASPTMNEYVGSHPRCAKCYAYHPEGGPCRLCYNCQKPSHITRDFRSPVKQVAPVNAIRMGDSLFTIDLIPFGHGSFDVITGMDWLSRHKENIVFHKKVVRMPLASGKILRVQGEQTEESLKSMKSTKPDEQKLDDISIVRDFPEVAEQEEAFQTLKDNLCNALILKLLDGPDDFVVYCDVSNQGFGCVLMQRGKSGVKDKILSAQGEASKVENALAEMLRGVDQQMEKNKDGARDRQKSYDDNRRKPLEYEVGDQVLLKMSPWKGAVRFGKKGKLAPRYVGPFEIIERIDPVAYRLRLPQELSSVHDTFHVSNLKKCLADANLRVPFKEIKVNKNLCFVEEPVEVMDRKVKRLKRSRIPIVKVRWNSK